MKLIALPHPLVIATLLIVVAVTLSRSYASGFAESDPWSLPLIVLMVAVSETSRRDRANANRKPLKIETYKITV
jgi:hypothetical protein